MRALTRMLMAHTTRANGKMINSTVKVLNRGRMEHATKALTKRARRKAVVDLRLQTAATTKERSTRTRFLAKEIIIGLTESRIQDPGQKIKWTVSEYSSGETARSTKETLSTTSVKDKARLFGLTVESISASGKQESNMESVLISAKTVYSAKASG